MNTILVSNPSEWPDKVSELSKRLSEPLPSWVETGPYPVLTNETKKLLPSAHPELFVGERDDFLDRVFDLTLQTCLSLRRCQRDNEAYPHLAQPTWPFMHLLFSALVLDAMPDANTSNGVSVVRPKSSKLSPEELTSFCEAQMLVAYDYTPEFPQQDTTSTTGPLRIPSDEYLCSDGDDDDDVWKEGGEDSRDRDIKRRTLERGLSFYNENYDKESSAASHTSSMLMPSICCDLEAHSVAGMGRRTNILVPIICVADDENIIPILSSALYQRHVLGIDLPILGVRVEKYGTYCQIIFGWLDHSEKNSDSLPLVCTAYAEEVDAKLGYFDLMDSMSALSFSHFMINLGDLFDEIAEAVPATAPQISDLSWRSDLVQKNNLSDIEEWRHEVYENGDIIATPSSPSSAPSSSLLPITPPLSTCELNHLTALNGESPSKMTSSAKKKGRELGSTVSEPLKPLDSHGGFLHPNSAKKSNLRFKQSKGKAGNQAQSPEDEATTIAYSNSSFANLPSNEQGLIEEPNAPNFIFERNAFRIANGIPSKDLPQHNEIDGYVKEYRKMFQILVPKEWFEDKLPCVDKALEPRLRKMVRQLKDLHDSGSGYVTIINSDESGNQQGQDRLVLDTVLSMLNVVLASSRCSSWRQGLGVFRGRKESECRCDWDQLLCCFGQAMGSERDETAVLLEATVKHSRNPTTDDMGMKGGALPTAVKFEKYSKLLRSTLAKAESDLLGSAVLQLLNRVEADRLELKRRASLGKVENLQEYQLRSIQEPKTAKCDAMVVTSMLTFEKEGRSIRSKLFHQNFSFVEPVDPEKQTTPSTDSNVNDITAFSCSCHNSPPLGHSQESNTFMQSPLDILVPVLIAEYKKAGLDNMLAVGHQSRTTMVSFLRWLSLCGVKDFMVYGLNGEASRGGIYGAWYSSREDCIFIMDAHVNTFDITDPIQAFQLVLFLVRLRLEVARNMQKRLETIRPGLIRRLESNRQEFTDWYNKVQHAELGPPVQELLEKIREKEKQAQALEEKKQAPANQVPAEGSDISTGRSEKGKAKRTAGAQLE